MLCRAGSRLTVPSGAVTRQARLGSSLRRTSFRLPQQQQQQPRRCLSTNLGEYSDKSMHEGNPPSESDMKTSVTVANHIAQSIVDAGVTHVFGGHGGTIVPLVDAIINHPKLTWVYTRHEASAPQAASAHGKLTGKLACAIATAGPGATNLTTGMIDAALDRIPVLVITGFKPTYLMHYTEFQDLDQTSIFNAIPIGKSTSLIHCNQTVPVLRDLVATAMAERTVVHLGLPLDISTQQITVGARNQHQLSRADLYASHMRLTQRGPHTKDLQATAETLVSGLGSRRLVIGVGRRALSGCDKAILALAETLNCPIVSRMDAKGFIDETHGLFVGCAGAHGKPALERARAMIESSDMVLSIGVEDHTFFLTGTTGQQTRYFIDIEPDGNLVKSRFHAEHTLLGNVHQTLLSLNDHCKIAKQQQQQQQQHKSHLQPQPQQQSFNKVQYARLHQQARASRDVTRGDEMDEIWLEFSRGNWGQAKQKLHSMCDFDYSAQLDPNFVHPAKFLESLGPRLQKGDILTMDTGDINPWALQCLTLSGGQTTLVSERMGTMGYALCAGLAGSMIRRNNKAIVLAGDGGFQMTLNELALMSQFELNNMVIIVFDNKVLARVGYEFPGCKGLDCPGPNFVTLIEAYGGQGVKIDSDDQIEAALDQAMASKVPFLIHAMQSPSVEAPMARLNKVGIPIHDLTPR